ncbi:MAG: zinc ABC transporter substrate-binding protein, partial [Patescibacteria group bacterium]|nr:zinc ABC transporter substrate-binding protein [Patescibacteria group bacterium]
MKKIELFALILGAVVVSVIIYVFGVIYLKKTTPLVSPTKKLQVVTTLFPLYDFARVIGKDKIEVSLLLPPGIEAHSFEPKPNDVIRINQADIFIYTGKFMEVWVDNVLKGVTNKNLLVVNASTGIKLISTDPHIWLDFDNAKTIVNSIAAVFAAKDPTNKAFYEKNAFDYDQNLNNLDQKYQSSLKDCQTREIIYGGHYAFGYLVNRYDLKYVAAQGISPDAEPTASDLVTLVNQIKKNNIKYVFYEELTSPKVAETLAN